MSRQHKLFVTSADHELGKNVVLMLASEQMKQRFSIVCGGQDREAMSDLEREGIKIVEYDPANRDDLSRHFKGCDGVLMIPPVRVHGRRGRGDEDTLAREHAEWVKKCGYAMIEAVEHANVKCSLLLSYFGSEKSSDREESRGKYPSKEHMLWAYHEVERHFEKSRIQNRVTLKNALLLNSFIAMSRSVQDEGVMPMATKEGQFAPIDLRDVCKAIAVVLSGRKHRPGRGDEDSRARLFQGMTWMRDWVVEVMSWPVEADANELIVQAHRGKTYRLTGPELITGRDLVNKASEAVGGKIKLKEVQFEELRAILRESEILSEGEADLLVEIHCLISRNKVAQKTHDFKELTGKEPTRVSEWFGDNSQHFQPSK